MLVDTIFSTVSYAIWSLSSIFTMLPNPKHNVSITYTLHTPDYNNPININSIHELNINPDYELKILCHGWSMYTNYSLDWYNYTIDEYMKHGNVNVITAEYEHSLRNLKFYKSVKYAQNIGAQIGSLIMNLRDIKGVPFSKVHILGHLLGAHAAGVAGETVYQQTGKYIDRITGLDPMSFGFFKFSTDGRLSRNDAVFVDVIHGSTGSFFEPIGRVDFFGYPYMTKCSINWFKRRNLSPLYYANTINNVDKFKGTKCLNEKYFYAWTHCKVNVTAYMGEHVDRDAFGKYYLQVEDIARYVCNNNSTTSNAFGTTITSTTEVIEIASTTETAETNAIESTE